MENDTFCFECPHCNSELELDIEGNVSIYQEPALQPNQRRGIGGLVTETNVNDKFYQEDYLRNQKPKPKPTMQPLGQLKQPDPEPIEADPDLMAAHTQDLKQRNLY